jgi:hypothetical protein
MRDDGHAADGPWECWRPRAIEERQQGAAAPCSQTATAAADHDERLLFSSLRHRGPERKRAGERRHSARRHAGRPSGRAGQVLTKKKSKMAPPRGDDDRRAQASGSRPGVARLEGDADHRRSKAGAGEGRRQLHDRPRRPNPHRSGDPGGASRSPPAHRWPAMARPQVIRDPRRHGRAHSVSRTRHEPPSALSTPAGRRA